MRCSERFWTYCAKSDIHDMFAAGSEWLGFGSVIGDKSRYNFGEYLDYNLIFVPCSDLDSGALSEKSHFHCASV